MPGFNKNRKQGFDCREGGLGSSGSQAPVWEPEAETPASRDWKLELPDLHSQAGAWE